MVAGSLPAGAMTLALFDPDLAQNTALATATGAAWFLAMLLVVAGGARLTVRAQLLMSGVELAILLFFVVAALLHTGYAAAFDWSWLGFSHFDGPAGFASGALVAAFYYWGWDVTSNLSEETRDSRRTAGLASLVGLGVVFLLFEAFTIAVNMILTSEDIRAGGANVLGALGDAIWPGVGGKLLVVAVLLSTVATLETTLIQVTRSLFAMGRDRTMPAALGTVHRRWNTPWVAVAVVGAVALAMFVASTALGSVGDVLSAAVSAIGLQIAFYYGLAGIAAVVAYRKTLLTLRTGLRPRRSVAAARGAVHALDSHRGTEQAERGLDRDRHRRSRRRSRAADPLLAAGEFVLPTRQTGRDAGHRRRGAVRQLRLAAHRLRRPGAGDGLLRECRRWPRTADVTVSSRTSIPLSAIGRSPTPCTTS